MSDRASVDTGGFGGGSGWTPAKGCAVAAGIGCIVVIALLATCVGGGALFLKRTTTSATTEIEPFLREISDERYDEAYERIADSWKATTTLDEFREQFTRFQQGLGAFESLSVRGLRFESSEESYREITYLARYENGTARIEVRLEKDDDGSERIAGVRSTSRPRAMPAPPATDDDLEPGAELESDADPVER